MTKDYVDPDKQATRFAEILTRFGKFWQRRVDSGQVCSFDADEWESIRCFLEWFLERYHVRLR